MRTPAEAEAFLKTPGVFETRAEVWRALLEFNPHLHLDFNVDELSAEEIDNILKQNHATVKTPGHAISWKYPLRDSEFSVNAGVALVGFRAHCNMNLLMQAGERLRQRAKAGKFRSIHVVRHYFMVTGMYPDDQKVA